ncbi:MAG TPA: hypothetical protein VMJ90_03045 [Anaerolineales bacterium]|nr:hypothetical protein [Anaerolineales bacterium]
MSILIHQRVALAREDRNSTVICRAPSGWVVLGDVQFLRGYSLLLPDPVVYDLNALSTSDRGIFLRDMTVIGDALLEITGAVRINYEILGNGEPALHAHLFPRFADEPEQNRRMPAWFYDWDRAPKFDFERDQSLMKDIAGAIQKRIGVES